MSFFFISILLLLYLYVRVVCCRATKIFIFKQKTLNSISNLNSKFDNNCLLMLPVAYSIKKNKKRHISICNLGCSLHKVRMIVRKHLLKTPFFLCGVASLSATSGSCVLANWRWQGQPERRKFRPLGRRSCHSLGGGNCAVWDTIKVMCYVSHTDIMCVSFSSSSFPYFVRLLFSFFCHKLWSLAVL